MIYTLKTMQVYSCVSSIKIVDNKIYTLNTGNVLNIFSKKSFAELAKHILIQDSSQRHLYDKTYAISSNMYFYASKYSDKGGSLFLLKDDKIIEKAYLDFHDEPVSVSTFSNNSQLLAIGGEDGKVFFYDLNFEKSIFSFNPRSDAISSISFSKNDKFTCVAAYDKSIIIYNILSNKKIREVELSDAVEDSIFLDNSLKIIGITRDKKLFLYDEERVETLKYSDFEFRSWPSVIIEIGYKHLLVATRSDILYLINSETLEITKEIILTNIGVKTLAIDEDSLYIGYIDGSIEVIDTMSGYKEFELNLKINKFDVATSLIEKNSFLLAFEVALKYDTIWEQVLDMAKTHILKKDEEKALKLVKPFFFDKKKEQEYNFLNANKNDISHFVELVKSEKDILAFRFADEIKHLKNTKEYATIEKRWQRVYQTCKLMFEKENTESSQKAINTLKRYAVIASKRKEIDNLIKNYKNFITAYKLVKARSFKLYFLLVKKRPFLAEEELYNKVNQIGYQTYLKLLDFENKEEFEKATAIAKYLLDFTDFAEKATEHIELIKLKSELQKSIDNDDIGAVYDIVNSTLRLENYKPFINYHKKFNNKRVKALEFAKNGKTEDVYALLIEYLTIEYLINSIALVFKLSYLSEMKNVAETNFDFIHWIKTLERYNLIYGLDNEILSFAKEFKLEELLAKYRSKYEDKDFKNSVFYDSIVVFL